MTRNQCFILITFFVLTFLMCLYVRNRSIDTSVHEIKQAFYDNMDKIKWIDSLDDIDIGLMPDTDGNGIGGLVYRKKD